MRLAHIPHSCNQTHHCAPETLQMLLLPYSTPDGWLGLSMGTCRRQAGGPVCDKSCSSKLWLLKRSCTVSSISEDPNCCSSCALPCSATCTSCVAHLKHLSASVPYAVLDATSLRRARQMFQNG